MRDLEREAADKRLSVERLLASSRDLDLIAEWRTSPSGVIVERLLEQHVSTWATASCWLPLDDEAKREQGRVLRSRELLEYFRGAEEASKQQRAEAMRLTTLLEAAADQGRISRI
jgi:hypothetical protein